MTEKQTARIKAKIDKYKKALADDKKMWGGYYHDGYGIRYLLPAEYIKLQDYKGGLRYLNWFDKNFPDDIGYPVFLFEATFILYKCNKLKEAEQKAHRTFFSNTYVFDKFLGKKSLQFDKYEGSNWEMESLVDDFPYSDNDLEFREFTSWLKPVLRSRQFLDIANEFIEIKKQLKTETDIAERTKLVQRLSKIEYGKELP